jgi:hypothetical protein
MYTLSARSARPSSMAPGALVALVTTFDRTARAAVAATQGDADARVWLLESATRAERNPPARLFAGDRPRLRQWLDRRGVSNRKRRNRAAGRARQKFARHGGSSEATRGCPGPSSGREREPPHVGEAAALAGEGRSRSAARPWSGRALGAAGRERVHRQGAGPISSSATQSWSLRGLGGLCPCRREHAVPQRSRSRRDLDGTRGAPCQAIGWRKGVGRLRRPGSTLGARTPTDWGVAQAAAGDRS